VAALELSVLHVLQSQLPVQHEGPGQVLALGSAAVFSVVPAFQRDVHHDINRSSPCDHVIKQSEGEV